MDFKLKNISKKIAACCRGQVALLGCFIVGCLLLQIGLFTTAEAQQGAGIFKNAACDLLDKVLTKDFGAMVTVVTGLLAIMASVTGSFKGAWALVFVSVGCFIYPYLVQTAFGIQC